MLEHVVKAQVLDQIISRMNLLVRVLKLGLNDKC